MIVTIDGPAGVGKSTIARRLADRLGFQFLNTGAMYRAVTVACLRAGVNVRDPAAVARHARSVTVRFIGDRVLADGEDVTDDLASEPVRDQIMFITDNPDVRAHLVNVQRQMVSEADYVSEGRDQGTVAFPQAVCKFFMTADPRERAERRLRQMTDRGEQASLDEILDEQKQRDWRDEHRPVGPLKRADDAIIVDSTGVTIEVVLDQMERAVREKLSDQPVQ